MKISIEKDNKTYKFDLIQNWKDVNLERWIKLMKVKDEHKANSAIDNIHALADIPKKLIKQLSIHDVSVIIKKIAEMQVQANENLQNIITVDNKEYGFHPNLDDMTIGEFADLEHYIKLGIHAHMPQIMAILYRPVVEKKNEAYTIEAYDGNITIRSEEFKKMSAEQVQSSLVFFWSLGSKLLKILPLYLMELAQKNLQMKTKEQR